MDPKTEIRQLKVLRKEARSQVQMAVENAATDKDRGREICLRAELICAPNQPRGLDLPDGLDLEVRKAIAAEMIDLARTEGFIK